MKFKVGDKVKFGGIEGVVCVNTGTRPFSLGVQFAVAVGIIWFTYDGKYMEEHTEPLLILVERPKRMIKRQIHRWVNVYRSDVVDVVRASKEDADKWQASNRIACVQLTGEYEVESDE